MKKKILQCACAAMLLFTGCYKDDINGLKDDINLIKEQLAKYETLLNALNSRLYITSYETTGDKYIITLSDGTKLNVGNSPAFVTVGANGNWLIDGIDSKVPAQGDQPQLSIGENGNWAIDGTDTGVKTNTTVKAGVTSIMAIVKANELMTFIFSDGKSIQLKSTAPEVNITTPIGGFVFDKMKWIKIAATVKYDEGAAYSWTLGTDTLSKTQELLHVFAKPGSYLLKFSAKNGIGTGQQEIVVTIKDKQYTNGVAKVFEYLPAPGQFVNTLPAWVTGEDQEALNAKAENALKDNSLVHLGGFGGYVVMGFDHTIVNTPGENSFLVKGNAFNNWSEPGIIMVSYDANGNGLPDDEWFEIAGSEYNHPKTVKNYKITYYKPDENKIKTPNNKYPYLTDTTYIKWKDNQGKSGYLSKNSFHNQSYYPQWKGDSITFTGTKLTEDNVTDLSGTGSYFVSPAFAFGYADNWGNGDDRAKIKIDWAVDAAGNPVKLKGVDFIKVYTGMRAEGGWLGEISTEIAGVDDLNLK